MWRDFCDSRDDVKWLTRQIVSNIQSVDPLIILAVKSKRALMTTSGSVRTVSDQITEQLRQSILAGEFPPGCPLREGELAERYQVSRHPIRKVLQQLTLEGLLVSKANCGVTVAAEGSEHVTELLTPMRVQLELYALRRVSSDQLQGQRSQWERVIRLMARAAEDKDEQAILSLDARFHQLLLIAADMQDCIPLWLAIYGRMRGHHRQCNSQLDDLGFIAFVHERLIQSFLTKDREHSSEDLQSHLESTSFNRVSHALWAKRKYPGTKR